MSNILAKVFSVGAEKLISTIGNVVDQIGTSREEKDAAKLAIQKEVNAHIQALEDNSLKELELENADRNSARVREQEFVKSTGRADYFQYFIGSVAVLTTCTIVFVLLFRSIPEKNEHVIMLFIGELLGIVTGIYAYHFGSSMGSRLKDMRNNSKT